MRRLAGAFSLVLYGDTSVCRGLIVLRQGESFYYIHEKLAEGHEESAGCCLNRTTGLGRGRGGGVDRAVWEGCHGDGRL